MDAEQGEKPVDETRQDRVVLHLTAGPEALDLATRLLQRLPAPRTWEAADVQWSWRRDQRRDPQHSAFALGAEGEPTGAALLTDWTAVVALMVIGDDGPELWQHVEHQLSNGLGRPVEIEVAPDDTTRQERLDELGFTPTDKHYVTCFVPSVERSPARPLPEGFTIVDRRGTSTPHPMISRNGEHIAERLSECSLYDPELDLAVVTGDGIVAGYALFWADPVTGTGLVEPMRTEDPFQGRGLGAALLSEGLERLARTCHTLKVTYEQDNPVSKRLYLAAGFRPTLPTQTWVRPARP